MEKTPLKLRKKTLVEETEEAIKKPTISTPPLNPSIVVSTGSTLVDLAISGKRIRGGGIPPGILVEIFGPSGTGKTALLAEIGSSCQFQGGVVKFLDPEARLDQEYSQIYGLLLSESGNEYSRPDTVSELINSIISFEVPSEVPIGVIAADSIAALSTDMEMDKEDKMGMRRAKEFSEGLRKVCRLISQDNRLVVFTNQIRQNLDAGMFGNRETTPGGMALPFYASLRLRIGFSAEPKIKKELTRGKVKIPKVYGIHSEIYVAKSSVDEPYRTAPVYIWFGYGIDDIRANLIYLKKMYGASTYMLNQKERLEGSIDESVKVVEDNGLEEKLREEVIELWGEIEEQMKVNRKPKIRR